MTLKLIVSALALLISVSVTAQEASYLGTKAPKGAKVYLDGTAKSLHKNWKYWEGPRFSAEMPIKWPEVTDPVDGGKAISSNDPAGAGGKYGAADIVTKDEFRDFEAHVEFLIKKKRVATAESIFKTGTKSKSWMETTACMAWPQ